MKKRIKVTDLPDFDFSLYLVSEVEIGAYLADILVENEPALLVSALHDIVRAKGLSEVTKFIGITSEAMQEVLRAGSVPQGAILSHVRTALCMRLAVPVALQSAKKHRE